MSADLLDRVTIYAPMPAMADVVSGAVPRPEPWPVGMTWHQWAAATPAWRQVQKLHGDGATLLAMDEAGELIQAGLGDPEREEMHAAIVVTADGRVLLIAINVDGTRYAVLGLAS